MPAKKKGPAFDMDSAFSGLFSTAPTQEPEVTVEPEPENTLTETVPQDTPMIQISDSAAVPVPDVPVNHRKPDDQLTRQYTITLKKGTHENLRDIAWYTRQSVSSILNNLADEYIRQHAYELEECHKINRR